MVTLNETAVAEVLPVPMLSVSNWGLRLGIGNTGSIITQMGVDEVSSDMI